MNRFDFPHRLAITILVAGFTGTAWPAEGSCEAQSASTVTPVIELYTSEGCSSCPPADKWVSSLKGKTAVVQAFHVEYWDYIGWIDRFAAQAYTNRQKQVAAVNGQRGVYTPQIVLNGMDWRDWGRALSRPAEPARANVTLKRVASAAKGDQFEAMVTPLEGASARWSAYWTVTENGHNSKVRAGENAGEFLQHDFVVRQYTPAGDYRGPARLTLQAIASDPAHPRQVNLVVFDLKTGKPLQALGLPC